MPAARHVVPVPMCFVAVPLVSEWAFWCGNLLELTLWLEKGTGSDKRRDFSQLLIESRTDPLRRSVPLPGKIFCGSFHYYNQIREKIRCTASAEAMIPDMIKGKIGMDIYEIKATKLFQGLTEEELRIALEQLYAVQKRYEKGEAILHAGDLTSRMGLVLEGSVTVESNTLWGSRTILHYIEKGQTFAETYALLENEPLLVDATANEPCRILLLKVDDLHRFAAGMQLWAVKLTTNLLSISSRKNLMLSGRSFHTAPKTVRGRLMSYLNAAALQKQSREFDIPFDRQQLADYLNLDRSALSKELGKMQQEGILFTKKNHFILKSLDTK